MDISYSSNSGSQSFKFNALAKPHLAQAIRHLSPVPASCIIRIADLGCSNGPNALHCAHFILHQITQHTFPLSPCIHYFFSDLPSNDFNHLFHALHSSTLLLPTSDLQRRQNVYFAGVPGSFYGRLFPDASLDLAVSTLALHWLSRVPASVTDPTSPAWNGGHVWIDGHRPNVCEAFAQQSQSDVKTFLKFRAQELTIGGILFLFSLSREEEHPTGSYFCFVDPWSFLLELTWNEAVSEGLVDANERDLFNVPNYNFSRAEFEAALQDVQELEVVKLTVLKSEEQLRFDDPQAFGDHWTRFTKSLIRPMVKSYIGEERTVQFFKTMQRIATERADLTRCTITRHVLLAILKRR